MPWNVKLASNATKDRKLLGAARGEAKLIDDTKKYTALGR
jgi:hypothetical protein